MVSCSAALDIDPGNAKAMYGKHRLGIWVWALECNLSPHDVCSFRAQALVRLGLGIIAEDRLKRAIQIEKGDAVMQSMLEQIQVRLKKLTRKPDT